MQCSLAFSLYNTWACQGRVQGSKERKGRKGRMQGLEPYNRFLSSCTKTGGYEKSEDGEFPPTEGSPYIHPQL